MELHDLERGTHYVVENAYEAQRVIEHHEIEDWLLIVGGKTVAMNVEPRPQFLSPEQVRQLELLNGYGPIHYEFLETP